jgi:DNA polymerase III subunit epsilon
VIVGFDLETTGVDCFNDVPVSYAIVGPDLRMVEYINSVTEIPDEASAIHGITVEMIQNGPSLVEAIDLIADTLLEVWRLGGAILGMNVSYDLTMVSCICESMGRELEIGRVIDILVIDRHYDKYRKGSRKLSALAEHYGVSLENAHSADADVEASLEIYQKQLEAYPLLKTITPKNSNMIFAAWYQDWLEGYANYSGKKIEEGRYQWPVHKKG